MYLTKNIPKRTITTAPKTESKKLNIGLVSLNATSLFDIAEKRDINILIIECKKAGRFKIIPAINIATKDTIPK